MAAPKNVFNPSLRPNLASKSAVQSETWARLITRVPEPTPTGSVEKREDEGEGNASIQPSFATVVVMGDMTGREMGVSVQTDARLVPASTNAGNEKDGVFTIQTDLPLLPLDIPAQTKYPPMTTRRGDHVQPWWSLHSSRTPDVASFTIMPVENQLWRELHSSRSLSLPKGPPATPIPTVKKMVAARAVENAASEMASLPDRRPVVDGLPFPHIKVDPNEHAESSPVNAPKLRPSGMYDPRRYPETVFNPNGELQCLPGPLELPVFGPCDGDEEKAVDLLGKYLSSQLSAKETVKATITATATDSVTSADTAGPTRTVIPFGDFRRRTEIDEQCNMYCHTSGDNELDRSGPCDEDQDNFAVLQKAMRCEIEKAASVIMSEAGKTDAASTTAPSPVTSSAPSSSSTPATSILTITTLTTFTSTTSTTESSSDSEIMASLDSAISATPTA